VSTGWGDCVAPSEEEAEREPRVKRAFSLIMAGRRRRLDAKNTLPMLVLDTMIGESVTVHLKDETVLTGILDSVNADMTLSLGKCSSENGVRVN
jgi:hypothetical protein